MANTPMVIMWPNSDGSTTLSQRQASAEVMPTVVASPPRVAIMVASLTAVRTCVCDTESYTYVSLALFHHASTGLLSTG